MSERRHELYLLTPGPLTVSPEVKAEMLLDRSPNAALHGSITQTIRDYMLALCNGGDTHVCVPLQGSATYGVEASLHTLVPRETSKILIIENGFYGKRLREIAEGARFQVTTLSLPMLPLPTQDDVEAALAADPAITHIMLCHAETGTGVLNPIAEVAAVAKRHGKRLMIDAVASFGGFPIDAAALDVEAIFVSPNKCLESVPGVAIVIAKKTSLEAAEGRSPSVVLDLHAQWCFMEQTGAWRWTPPTHVVGALGKACERHRQEGMDARRNRYITNWRRLVDGLRQRGLTTLLPDGVAAPIIATFHDPVDPGYSFGAFYEAMARRGFVIFPGRLTAAGTFRIGVMGDIVESDISLILNAIDESFAEIGVATAASAA
ncbi:MULTISPECIES: 2-aminoethylphosphonate--pyruvate transaminase [unclassified Chelatococcus]|uniref:2-aminoethylphosphonate--pyruvate transaminase n=1 Tax=unclassified Chelatococcus TaxID=2638111 RepID=UPI001BCBFEB2|nr:MULTISPECIES: 2-aminoethylphosphonate--pyruvate transaminase [unclassified Chelatococcus]CAH1654641.1 2-aminoethylphosphonate--pyruvate transaminase [Hyphomicrobiales bacterium]MBS7742762.1 2-aminoethylphosphonate--pyruvate transaminase [Chelatococcus sp. HY11]MBX3542120.1 2-aminoethylphosphonate--pyruvate transaminase [Chelatococcus sp.]MCO5075665.1 2-aminoethylphosphonate--pyruvate transaminase [Chelatococcus sp.]CAH1694993.1 2-aminoethylphosphonate--pyruvate transaminase [Hyphomicrobiale